MCILSSRKNSTLTNELKIILEFRERSHFRRIVNNIYGMRIRDTFVNSPRTQKKKKTICLSLFIGHFFGLILMVIAKQCINKQNEIREFNNSHEGKREKLFFVLRVPSMKRDGNYRKRRNDSIFHCPNFGDRLSLARSFFVPFFFLCSPFFVFASAAFAVVRFGNRFANRNYQNCNHLRTCLIFSWIVDYFSLHFLPIFVSHILHCFWRRNPLGIFFAQFNAKETCCYLTICWIWKWIQAASVVFVNNHMCEHKWTNIDKRN